MFCDGYIATINFDRFHVGYQLMDLYQFLRKAMEKNRYDITMAKDILSAAVTIAKPFVVVCEIILKQRQALLCLAVKIIKCLYVQHLKVILQGSPADKISYPAKLIYLSIQISR